MTTLIFWGVILIMVVILIDLYGNWIRVTVLTFFTEFSIKVPILFGFCGFFIKVTTLMFFYGIWIRGATQIIFREILIMVAILSEPNIVY